MTRTAFSVLAAVVLAATLATPAALANGDSRGTTFDVSMVEFSDRVYLGASITGEIRITMHEDSAKSSQLAQVALVTETPIGPATIATRTVKVTPGRTRTLRVELPVSEDASTGDFTFNVRVTVGTETLSVNHSVYVLGGK